MKFLLTIGVVFFASTAQAATFVGTRDALESNDAIDWTVLGSTFTPVSNPIETTSSGGIGVNASIPSGSFVRIDQTPLFPGAFDVGDALLFTGLGNPGPLTITFKTPILGVGTQIQSDPLNIPDYTATIEAFDSFDRSLGRFELASVSQRAAGSGVSFVGVADSSGDIKKLVLNTQEQGADVPFALNEVSLKTNFAAVPEPSPMLGLLLVGTASAILRLRGKKI